jgi:DNA polymerase-3 subunit delta
MIVKFFDLKHNNLYQNKLILLYGDNEGLKNEVTLKIIKNHKVNILEEKDIFENKEVFFDNLYSGSLFDKEKFFVVKRSTDKIIKIIEEIKIENINDTVIILNSGVLEKKSKLRSLFEKNKKFICVAFYPDTEITLSKIANSFLREKKIMISQSDINLIVNKCSGDRISLKNELEKIDLFSHFKKKITTEEIKKLTNLRENHSITELVDNCLAKNNKKIIKILNENNFSNEDCIMITRSFLLKAKKLLTLSTTFETNKNIDLTISSAKPPIFWKEKEITKQQIYKWKSENIKQLIYKLSETELQIKKNINNSINIITDFILSQSLSETNN